MHSSPTVMTLSSSANTCANSASTAVARRRALLDKRLPFSIVTGRGDARLQSALAAVKHLSMPSIESPKWHWICDRCGDTDCERHLLPLPLGEGRGEGCGAD